MHIYVTIVRYEMIDTCCFRTLYRNGHLSPNVTLYVSSKCCDSMILVVFYAVYEVKVSPLYILLSIVSTPR